MWLGTVEQRGTIGAGGHSQVHLGVDLRIAEVLADICEQDLHLFRFPAQQLRVQAHGETFQSVFDLHQIPGSEGFLSGSVSQFW